MDPTPDLIRDAARYRWLKSRTSLRLESSGSKWIREDGSVFFASHHLAEGGTGHAHYPTLDETIDQAMEVAKERDTGWLEPLRP